LFSILFEVLVLFHVNYDTGSLIVSKLVNVLAFSAAFLNFVSIYLNLLENCGMGAAIAIAAFFGILSFYGSAIFLGIAFANTVTLIGSMAWIVIGNALLIFINNTFTELGNRLCSRISWFNLYDRKTSIKYS